MIITLGTPKGGAGKTTAILTICNAICLMQPDRKIAVIDTDTSVGSLTGFWKKRKERDALTENLRLWSAPEISSQSELFELIAQAVDWADYTLIDVQGAVSELNRSIVEISDLTIVPSRIGTMDLEPAVTHLQDYQQSALVEGTEFTGRLLFTFTEAPIFMSATTKMFLKAVKELEECRHFETMIQARSIYKDAQDYGLLLSELPKKMHSKGLSAATDESMRLFEEILELHFSEEPIELGGAA